MKYRLLGPQAPLFLGGATSLCLHLLRKLGGTHILNCTLAAIALVHHKFISVSQNYHITWDIYFSLCVCVCFGICFFNGIFVPLHLLVPWSGSGQIAQKSPAAHQICLKVLKTYPHLTRKSLVASSGRDCHCLTVKIRMGMMGYDGTGLSSFNMLKQATLMIPYHFKCYFKKMFGHSRSYAK